MTTSSQVGGIRVKSRTSGQEWEFGPGKNLVLARDPDADIPLRHPKVSRSGHAELRWSADGWVLHDTSARLGGVMVNGTRQSAVPVTGVLVVQLGDGETGEELELRPVGVTAVVPQPEVAREPAAVTVAEPAAPIAPEPPPAPVTGPRAAQAPAGGWPESIGIKPGMSVIHQVPSTRVLIGRGPDCQVVLSDLLVSRHHAELLWENGGWTLRDLGSHNGTYVDGMRISVAPVTPNSVIGIGHQTFHLVGNTLEEFRDTGEVALDARRLIVDVGTKRLLDEVSFHLAPSSMLAIVGPSGAGKSTLLRALTGLSPATSGYVSYDGRDLYSNYEEIRHRIGYVPQDDILHPQLRVRRALSYSAQLRFPQDVPAMQRNQRVQEVIDELGLANQAEQRISTLSGGQRKRTSTALELLTRPTLLFLDEPTSGLDVLREREVMQSLRRLADGGRTVIVVSHAIANLDICDRLLVLAPGGQVAYYGPPQKALAYFGVSSYEDAFAQLEAGGVNWRARYEASPEHGAYAAVPPQAPLAGQGAGAWVSPPRQQSQMSQYATLTRRYLSVIAADRQFVLLTAVSPLALAALARAVPAKGGLDLLAGAYRTSTGVTTHSAMTLLLVLVLGGSLVGVASSLWEIVKERSIFLRERLIGLSWTAYLASKATVLGVVTAVQAVVLVLLAMAGRKGPYDPLVFGGAEITVIVVAVTVASMALGLALSALVSNPERAMPLLVLVVMAQMVASGGLFAIHGRAGLEEIAAILPARWSFAGGAASVGLGNEHFTSAGGNDPAWHHTATALGVDLFLMLVLAAIFVGATGLLLRRVGRPTGRVGVLK